MSYTTAHQPRADMPHNQRGSFRAREWVRSLGIDVDAHHTLRKTMLVLAAVADHLHYDPSQYVPRTFEGTTSAFGPVALSSSQLRTASMLSAGVARAAQRCLLAVGLLRPGTMRAAWLVYEQNHGHETPAQRRKTMRLISRTHELGDRAFAGPGDVGLLSEAIRVIYPAMTRTQVRGDPDAEQRLHAERVEAAVDFMRTRMPIRAYGSPARRELLIDTLFRDRDAAELVPWPAADVLWCESWTTASKREVGSALLHGGPIPAFAALPAGAGVADGADADQPSLMAVATSPEPEQTDQQPEQQLLSAALAAGVGAAGQLDVDPPTQRKQQKQPLREKYSLSADQMVEVQAAARQIMDRLHDTGRPRADNEGRIVKVLAELCSTHHRSTEAMVAAYRHCLDDRQLPKPSPAQLAIAVDKSRTGSGEPLADQRQREAEQRQQQRQRDTAERAAAEKAALPHEEVTATAAEIRGMLRRSRGGGGVDARKVAYEQAAESDTPTRADGDTPGRACGSA